MEWLTAKCLTWHNKTTEEPVLQKFGRSSRERRQQLRGSLDHKEEAIQDNYNLRLWVLGFGPLWSEDTLAIRRGKENRFAGTQHVEDSSTRSSCWSFIFRIGVKRVSVTGLDLPRAHLIPIQTSQFLVGLLFHATPIPIDMTAAKWGETRNRGSSWLGRHTRPPTLTRWSYERKTLYPRLRRKSGNASLTPRLHRLNKQTRDRVRCRFHGMVPKCTPTESASH